MREKTDKNNLWLLAFIIFIGTDLVCTTATAGINWNGAKIIKEVEQEVKLKRTQLHNEWKRGNAQQRKDVIAKTRAYVEQQLLDTIFPAWYGMPWTMAVIKDGLKPDAKYPGEKYKGISCSWFVVSTLENAGFQFLNRRKFAGTIAIHFQRSTTPNKKNLKRIFNVNAKQLHDRFLKLGDGMYIIGLNCHIGFVSVKGDQVDVIHSNYMSPWEVVREPVLTSQVIQASEDAGFVVSALFKDSYLLTHWLGNTKIPFKAQ